MTTAAARATGLVVEYAGLPGAGKTTIAESTHRALLAAGVRSRVSDAGIAATVPVPVRAGRRLALAGSELARGPVQGAETLRAIHRLSPGSSRDELAGAVQWFAVQRLQARASLAPGVHLLQEGPVQTLWTLALRSRGRRDELVRLLRPRTRTTEHLLVVVDAPLAVVSARLAARASAHSRTQRLGEGEWTAELVAGRQLLRDLLDLADRGHLLLVNDGRESVEELGRRVAGWVLRAGS